MPNTWEASRRSYGQPDALDLLLYETDDKLDEIFSDTDLVDELARSFYAMDNYVAEVGFIADALFKHPEAVEVMASRLTSLRELLLRDMSRLKLFNSTEAVGAMSESNTAMEYLATNTEFGEDVQRQWISDALDTLESRQEFILNSTIALEQLSNSRVAMDEIQKRESVMVDALPTDESSVDIFFQSDYHVGDALATHNDRLDGSAVEGKDTLGEILTDRTAVGDIVSTVDKTIELIRLSENVALSELLSSDVATDVVTDNVAATEFFISEPYILSLFLSSTKAADSLWQKSTSSLVWDKLAGSFPTTQNGVGIEGTFSVAEGRVSTDSTALEVAWTSDGDADSFTGLGINVDADVVDTFTINTSVDTTASGTLTVEVDDDRALEVLDTDHDSGWQSNTIDISTYSGETTIMLGVTQKTTTELTDGVFRFGDFRFN